MRRWIAALRIAMTGGGADWPAGMQRRFVLVTSASHMPRSGKHFERAGLAPVASPTLYRTGRSGPHRLSYWVPSSEGLRKTERAVYEYLGLWSLGLEHRNRSEAFNRWDASSG